MHGRQFSLGRFFFAAALIGVIGISGPAHGATPGEPPELFGLERVLADYPDTAKNAVARAWLEYGMRETYLVATQAIEKFDISCYQCGFFAMTFFDFANVSSSKPNASPAELAELFKATSGKPALVNEAMGKLAGGDMLRTPHNFTKGDALAAYLRDILVETEPALLGHTLSTNLKGVIGSSRHGINVTKVGEELLVVDNGNLRRVVTLENYLERAISLPSVSATVDLSEGIYISRKLRAGVNYYVGGRRFLVNGKKLQVPNFDPADPESATFTREQLLEAAALDGGTPVVIDDGCS